MNDKREISSDSSLIKLPRSSYSELVKIIMAYSKVAKPASLDDIAQRCAVNKYSVSSNSAFLSSVGLIEGGKAKMATELGIALGRALDHDHPEEIANEWRQVVQQSPFFDKVVSAVRIRQFFETSAFESHIAYSSGEPKSPQIMTGARTIVDILKIAGIISEADGKIVLATSTVRIAKRPPEEIAEFKASTDMTGSQTVYSMPYGQVLVRINLNINADPASLDGLGEKIRKVIQDIEGAQSTEKPQQG